jgi:DNA-binding transcriptional LysR family regulator
MEIREFQYLIAIAEEKSISKAAERLYIAQSSLSQFLSTYEANLGYPLFIRQARGVRLTEAGKKMLDFAYEVQNGFHRAQDEMQDISNLKSGNVILGISTFRGSFLLPPVLSAFHKKWKDVHVTIVEGNTLKLEQLLISGDIDIALLVKPEKKSSIKAEFLMKDEVCLIANPDDPVMNLVTKNNDSSVGPHQHIDIHDAMQFEFLLSSVDTILGLYARRIFQRYNLTPICANDNLSAFMAASMAAHGVGLAFTYFSAHERFREAEFISLGKDQTYVELSVALAPGRYHSKAALALRQTFFDVLGSNRE